MSALSEKQILQLNDFSAYERPLAGWSRSLCGVL